MSMNEAAGEIGRSGLKEEEEDSDMEPHQELLGQIDWHYPPGPRPIHPESFSDQEQQPSNESVTVKSPQTAAASLYCDALYSIFQFLTLREFVSACVINKSWYSGGQQMRSRKEKLSPKQPIVLLVQSPLRHHITDLNLRPSCFHAHCQIVDPSTLMLLQDRMDHLEQLNLWIKLTKDDVINYSSPLCFTIPRHLRELRIEFDLWEGCDLTTEAKARTYIDGCLKEIAAHSTRLNTLRASLTAERHGQGVLGEIDCPQELQTMSSVTHLELPRNININQQIDLIKSMPSLSKWSRRNALSTALVQRLADGPTGPPNLEDIGSLGSGELSELIDDAMAEQLKRLVTLTKLNIYLILIDLTKILPHFPRLSILNLHCEEYFVDVNLLVVALSTCVSLTDFSLTDKKLTSHHMGQFLPHLSSLVKLTLSNCNGLASLEFLTTARASLGNLRIFTIYASYQIPNTEYHHHLRSIIHTRRTHDRRVFN